MDLEGGCLCGAVRYRIAAAPDSVAYCHCRLCQRSSGAPVLAWASVAVAGFAFTAGEPATYRSSEIGLRQFCRLCGTQLLFRHVRSARTVDINVGSLDDPARLVPQYHIWTASRLPWFDTVDALPRYPDAGPDDLPDPA